jgi:hypothetical protein
MTAKTVLLPEEDPAEFKQHMVGWFESIKPEDRLEASLVERGAYSLWQLDRVSRSQAAQLWLNADRHAEDQEKEVGTEVAALLRRLLAAPNGRPTAFPCTSRPDEDTDDSKRVGPVDPSDLPKELIRKLGTSGLGCQRLLEIWSELQASLEQDGWQTAERFRAFRLLGIHPSDAYMTTELASLLQACQAIDPDAGSLVGEVWNDIVPRDFLPALEANYQREIAHRPRLDQVAARQYLREIIRRKTGELKTRLARHQERAEAQTLLIPHQMAFDDSREGRLLRRYENTCKQFFLRCLDEVRMHREEKAERAKHGIGARYFLPPPAWFEGLERETTAEIDARRVAEWQQCQADSRALAQGPAEIRDGAQISGAEKELPIEDVHAAEQRECHSHAATCERDGGAGEEVDAGVGNGAEISSRIGAQSNAERAERKAMEGVSLAEITRRLATQRSRVVGGGASVGSGLTTNNAPLSNKERKRRRREERKRIRELSVVSAPLSVV